MFQQLLQKTIKFAKLYDDTKDLSLLINCHNVPEYQEMLKVFHKFTLKDLLLEDKEIKESFKEGAISSVTITEEPMFSIGYFFIPAGQKLSLHDHPGMLVTSKILMGKIERRALDLVHREKQFEFQSNTSFDVEENPFADLNDRLDAIVDSNEVFSEGDLIHLTPISGNIHSFKALEDTIMIDILTPYYDQEIRYCNYYKELDPPKETTKKGGSKRNNARKVGRKEKGYKTTLVYLYKPPMSNFEALDFNPLIMGEDYVKGEDFVKGEDYLKPEESKITEEKVEREAQ